MNQEREIRDYLLGAVSAERQEEVEKRILSDDEFHLEVETVEEELLDDYVRERLSQPERRLCEENFLASPLRQRKLRFARVFRDKLNPPQETKTVSASRLPSQFYPYTLVASLLLAAFAGGMGYRSGKKLEEEYIRNAALSRQLDDTRLLAAQVSPNSVVQANLIPKGTRGALQPPLRLPKGIIAVQFRLAIPNTLQAPVDIDVLNDAGQRLVSLQGGRIERNQDHAWVALTIGTEYLGPGDYILRVSMGTKPLTSLEYSFQVLPQEL